MTTQHYARISRKLEKVGLVIYDIGKATRPFHDAIFYTRGDGKLRNSKTEFVFEGSKAVEKYCEAIGPTMSETAHENVPQTTTTQRVNENVQGTKTVNNKPEEETMDITILMEARDIVRKVFEEEGEEGVRQLYREVGPPVVGWNSRGEIVPLGWALMDGEIVLFMDRYMAPDGDGGFVCEDCGRDYFECICPPATF